MKENAKETVAKLVLLTINANHFRITEKKRVRIKWVGQKNDVYKISRKS